MNREQNRLFLTLVAYSWIQKKLTQLSSPMQSHGSGFILTYNTQMFVCVKGRNENKSVGRNKVVYFLWVLFLPTNETPYPYVAPDNKLIFKQLQLM